MNTCQIQVRSIFLSDIHLGTKACQAAPLLEFLKAYTAQHMFLLGDIVDLWAMSRGGVHWTSAQNTFVQKMLRRSRHGEKVIFIPGNHDEAMREYAGAMFGDVMVLKEHIHTAADGRRYLLLHGDEFDQVTLHHKWIAILGDMAYNLLVSLNTYPGCAAHSRFPAIGHSRAMPNAKLKPQSILFSTLKTLSCATRKNVSWMARYAAIFTGP
jgi:UDP-2,3-diacylglucosamine pyrophosphatase LpxH